MCLLLFDELPISSHVTTHMPTCTSVHVHIWHTCTHVYAQAASLLQPTNGLTDPATHPNTSDLLAPPPPPLWGANAPATSTGRILRQGELPLAAVADAPITDLSGGIEIFSGSRGLHHAPPPQYLPAAGATLDVGAAFDRTPQSIGAAAAVGFDDGFDPRGGANEAFALPAAPMLAMAGATQSIKHVCHLKCKIALVQNKAVIHGALI